MSKNLNYNTDSIKHYVRYHGWKVAFKSLKNYVDREIRNKKREVKCKYLTFCAVQAIDIFMLERERSIYRDPATKRLANVYFCENDEESFALINKMIGSNGQGFFGDFKDIVLQDLDEPDIVTSDPFNEPSSIGDRENLRLKEVKRNLLNVFPFDVINLDFYGNFFPANQDRFSDSCQTYREVLGLQKVVNGYSCDRFLMFLTVYTPVLESQVNSDVMKQFVLVLNQNMGYETFRRAFTEKFETQLPSDLELYMTFVLGFTKQIIFRESYRLGWQPKVKEIYCYDRHNEGRNEPYKISTFVVEYRRNSSLEEVDFAGSIPRVIERDYLIQLHDIISNKPHIVPNEAQVPEAVKEDLRSVVSFRNEFLKEIGVYDESKFQ